MLTAKIAARYAPYSKREDYQELKDWEELQDARDRLQIRHIMKNKDWAYVTTSNYKAAMVLLKALEQEDKSYRKLKGKERNLMLKFMEEYIGSHPGVSDVLQYIATKPHGYTVNSEEPVRSPKGNDT